MSATEQQLTLDVGGQAPDTSITRVSGALHTHRQLVKGEEVHIQIVDADGVVISDGYGRVLSIQFKDKYDENGDLESTTRIHGIKAS